MEIEPTQNQSSAENTFEEENKCEEDILKY